MALQITTQIGTDKGITSEAYVRISEYNISKTGIANFNIQLFQTTPESTNIGDTANSQQIGNSLRVELIDYVEETESYPGFSLDEEGNQVETVEQKVVTRKVVNLTPAQEVDIFTFGYSHLKAKLVDLFGEENIVDC